MRGRQLVSFHLLSGKSSPAGAVGEARDYDEFWHAWKLAGDTPHFSGGCGCNDAKGVDTGVRYARPGEQEDR